MSNEEKPMRAKIKPRLNGSLRVDANGNPISTGSRGKGNFALCCCGYSKHKPFCDGTHKKTDFRSARLSEGEWDFRSDYAGDGAGRSSPATPRPPAGRAGSGRCQRRSR